MEKRIVLLRKMNVIAVSIFRRTIFHFTLEKCSCLVRLSEKNGDEGRGQLEIFRPELQKWIPACVTHWDQSSSPNAICALLGYS